MIQRNFINILIFYRCKEKMLFYIDHKERVKNWFDYKILGKKKNIKKSQPN